MCNSYPAVTGAAARVAFLGAKASCPSDVRVQLDQALAKPGQQPTCHPNPHRVLVELAGLLLCSSAAA